MSVLHANTALNTTAVPLWTRPPYGPRGRIRVLVQNRATNAVYLGGPGVTTTSYGITLAANGTTSIELNGDEMLWGAAGVAQTVNVLVLGT